MAQKFVSPQNVHQHRVAKIKFVIDCKGVQSSGQEKHNKGEKRRSAKAQIVLQIRDVTDIGPG